MMNGEEDFQRELLDVQVSIAGRIHHIRLAIIPLQRRSPSTRV
jgi:hypothetical protein